MKTSFLFLAKGFEEIEAISVADILRRAGIPFKLISMSGEKEVTGEHGITVIADELYEKAKFDDVDFYIIPGGVEGTKNLFPQIRN